MIEDDRIVRCGGSVLALVDDRAALWYNPGADDDFGSTWDDLIRRLDVLGFTEVAEEPDAVINEYVVWLLRKGHDVRLPEPRGSEAPELQQPVHSG